MSNSNTANQLKKLREEHGLTQEALAEKAEVSRSTIANIEVGAINPSVKLAKKLGEVLDAPWTTFFEEVD